MAAIGREIGLFGDSLVALDASTGKRLGIFRPFITTLWDYDFPAQPTLVQVRKDGKLWTRWRR